MPDGRPVESCADPTVIRAQSGGDTAWYLYCTGDPLGDWDGDGAGNYNYHLIPMFRSTDLVHWTYQGDALRTRPGFAESWANVWAPEIRFWNGTYYLYYAVTDTRASTSGEANCGSDSAIAVATGTSPTGPFTNATQPVVAPRRNGTGCDFFSTIDPDVVDAGDGQRYIYYGSFYGGVQVRQLSTNGLNTSPLTAVQLTVWDRYEGPEVVRKDGWYYLFVSEAGCCDGPLSGYAVRAGRSASPTGPFVDREGVRLDAARAGGSTVLTATGNRWVGPGHNSVLTDSAGQAWTIYHAIDVERPYFANAVGFTRRPLMLDPLDWQGGWPVVRGGWSVSSCAQPVPAAQAGDPATYDATWRDDERPGTAIAARTDEFDGNAPGSQWSWIRPPAGSAWGVAGGVLRIDTSATDLYEDNNTAPILVESAPAGDFVVETKVALDVPSSGCCYNYVQAGLVIRRNDDNYVKLVHSSIWSDRLTEWAKEVGPVASGWPRYDKSFVGPPADWTWLRIARRVRYADELYTAYTSIDGVNWTRGTTWTHALGGAAQIGLVAMNVAGYHARFDYVHVWTLAPDECSDITRADPCDTDRDGVGDLCDADDDGDGVDDLIDCDALEHSFGRPPSVQGFKFDAGSVRTYRWDASPSADTWDVTRGDLRRLTRGHYGKCHARSLPVATADDPERPASGEGFSYLVRGVDAGCGGAGTWGTDSDGIERVNTDPDGCP